MTEKTTDNSVIDPKSSAQDSDVSDISNLEKKDTVAYETYQRTLSESKKAKSQAAELKAKLEQYEQEKLMAEGKKDEVISKLKKDYEDVYGQLKKTKEEIAYSAVFNQVEKKAIELGCIDTDALTKLVDFTGLDVGEGNKVSAQSLEMVLGKAKEAKPYLFSKSAPVIHDGAPTTKIVKQDTGIPAKMTIEEMKKKAMEIDRLEGRTLGWGK
ncbi:hypothetical protein KDA08_05705 [Candidatus Saccharibacteria bacterium]|nr:hypothetical protein [Candidatus Saccharibacteria bacterium]